MSKRIVRIGLMLIALMVCLFSFVAYAHAEIQKAMFPIIHATYISQVCESSVPEGDWQSHYPLDMHAIDVFGEARAYAPFDCKIVDILPAQGNVVIFESLEPVLMRSGLIDYVHVAFVHTNDISGYSIGKVYRQGELCYIQGNAGFSGGPHIHIEPRVGKYSDYINPNWSNFSPGGKNTGLWKTGSDLVYMKNKPESDLQSVFFVPNTDIFSIDASITGNEELNYLEEAIKSWINKWNIPTDQHWNYSVSNTGYGQSPTFKATLTHTDRKLNHSPSVSCFVSTVRTDVENAASNQIGNTYFCGYNEYYINESLDSYTFSIDAEYFVNSSSKSFVAIPGQTYYYKWTTNIDGTEYTSNIGSFTMQGTSPQPKSTNWYSHYINTTTPDAIHQDMSDTNPQVNGLVEYDQNRKLVEAGCFLSTSKTAVEGALRGSPNGTFNVKDVAPGGLLSDPKNTGTVYTRVAYTLQGATATSMGFGMNSTNLPAPGQTVYYKFYSVLDNGEVKYSDAVQQFTMPGKAATPPTITTTSLPSAQYGVAYSHTLAASGDTPISWSIESGSLPYGLSLNSTTGVISGTPTAGAKTFTVKATNAGGSDTQELTLQVAFTTYSYSVVAGEGGTVWADSLSGTAYASVVFGIQAQPQSGYVFSHWTATTGTFDDAYLSTTGFKMAAADTVITAHFIRVPVITTNILATGEVGKAYSQTLAANGTTPLTWSVSSGSLPAGLSMNSNGIISGTPTASGTSRFTVKVSNAGGSATCEYTLTIKPKPVAPVIADYDINSGKEGTEFMWPVALTQGDAPRTYTISAGSLPAGLSLSSTGYISGIPTVNGTFNFTVTVTNAGGSDSKAYTLTIDPKAIAPAITTSSLSDATVGTAYSQSLTASGTTPITWSMNGGTLPDGLSLDPSTGIISGTPTTAGEFYFTVKASNEGGSATKSLGIKVNPAPVPPVINTVTPAKGTVGAEYSLTLSATGDAPITWSVSAGSLPAGLTLSADGMISGTPTTVGTYSFTVQATNGAGDASKELTIVVEAAPVAPTIEDVTLANGTVDSAYSVALSATGDTPITWSVSVGNLPAGLTLSANGTISGTPTTAGTYIFTVQATNDAGSDTKELTIVVEAAPVAPTIGDVTLAMGTVDSEYSVALSATGDAPITWSVTSGDLPAGLTLSADGTISGTPTAAGSYTFTVQATNDAGSDAKELTIVVEAAPVAPTIGDVTLAMGTVDSEYSVALSATGDAPITWSVTSGDLPAGLTLSTDGTISGMPTTAGTYIFTVKATNDAGSDTKELTIVVEAAPVAPTIDEVTLANGTVDSSYSATLSATGDAPITWSVSEGELPTGLTLSAGGTISGTPTTASTYTFTVKATNNAGSDTKELTIVVEAAPVAPAIEDVMLANGTVDSTYSVALSATGDAPITWSVSEGELPTGLTLSADGTISGTPTTASTYTFTVKATNNAGSDTKELTIVVEAAPVAPAIEDVMLANGTVDSTYSVALSATGDAPITWSVTSGELPTGLTLSADGTISGTPTTAGTYIFTVKATNDAGSDTKELTIVVENAPVQPVAPTIKDVTLANGTVDSEYSAALSATGDAPITWSVSEGELPTGLTLSADGTISGTPTTASTYTFTVKATNNAGSDTKELTIVVEAAPVAPAIEDVMLANGTVDSTYSVALSATGDAPITWSVTSGELPAGLTLSADGTISGTPTTAGSYTFTVQATNGTGSDTKELTIVVEAAPVQSVAPIIGEVTPANGIVGTPYSLTLSATGDAPITWSVTSGDLPSGLTLGADGTITGTPTTAGSYTFTVKAGNDAGNATKELTIVVEAVVVQPIVPEVAVKPSSTFIQGKAGIVTLSIGEEIDGFGIDNFKALRVDGSQLASSSNTYSVKNGSIIVQFSPTYLNTLVVGTHNVTVDLQGSGYEGMSVSTILRVIPQETQESVSEIPPKTGDKTPLMLLMILAIGACGGCLLLTKKKAKQ